jgi:hypothetical protein
LSSQLSCVLLIQGLHFRRLCLFACCFSPCLPVAQPMRYLYQMPRHLLIQQDPMLFTLALTSSHLLGLSNQHPAVVSRWKIRSLLTTVQAHSEKIIRPRPRVSTEKRSFARANNPSRRDTKTDRREETRSSKKGPSPSDPLAREDRGRRETRTGGGRR